VQLLATFFSNNLLPKKVDNFSRNKFCQLIKKIYFSWIISNFFNRITILF